MICPKCKKESAEGARFCQDCGQSFSQAPSSKRLLVPIIASVVVVFVCLLAFVLARGSSRSQLPTASTPTSPSANVAQAPVQQAPSQLAQAPVGTPPPSQVAAGQKPAGPPKEVVDYLQKLQALETQRKQIASDGGLAGDMMKAAYGGGFNPNDDSNAPPKAVTDGYRNYIARLQTISVTVRSLPTPQVCLPLANSYLSALNSHVALINDLRNAVQTQDINKALAMQQGSVPQYTAALKNADNELDKLCSSTRASKNFSVSD